MGRRLSGRPSATSCVVFLGAGDEAACADDSGVRPGWGGGCEGADSQPASRSSAAARRPSRGGMAELYHARVRQRGQGGKAVGTVWIVHHDDRQFDAAPRAD